MKVKKEPKIRMAATRRNLAVRSKLKTPQLDPGADCGQKASAAKDFIKATETLRKKPLFHYKRLAILEKASISLKESSKIIEIFIKAAHF
jgi:hypothetical protein